MSNVKIGTATAIVTGGVAVSAIPANVVGGVIANPVNAIDQGLGASEDIIVGPIDAPPDATPGNGNGKYFVISPGGTWTIIPGQDTATFVNAASSGHKFSAIYW